jgi:hypothetical protein
VVQLLATASFLVECFWPDLDQRRVEHAGERLAESAAQRRRGGCSVAYLGSIQMTGDDVVFFLFEADSATEVQKVCELAELQFERVVGSVVSPPH